MLYQSVTNSGQAFLHTREGAKLYTHLRGGQTFLHKEGAKNFTQRGQTFHVGGDGGNDVSEENKHSLEESKHFCEENEQAHCSRH